ncbi:MAG: ImmA/IrrE family metallo-endopeptidase [Phycisphaerales bacterium]|nr:ImmA/IrrE family metallo-endopeptidase [Phycisphaerales bacterium]
MTQEIPNPAMVVVARECRGLHQKDLAKALGCAQSTISKYEIGSLCLPHDHTVAIASALKFDIGFFYQRDMVYGLGGDFLYRRRASVTKKMRTRVEAQANVLKMQVERLLRSSSVEQAFPFPAIDPGGSEGSPEDIANVVRQAWRLPDGPIRNLTRVIEHAGGIVFTLDYQTDKIDGTNIRTPALPPMLFMNKNKSGERHRFNLAHETGHLVMHFFAAMEDAETQADRFASEFLMPRKQIQSDLKNLDLPAAARLKDFWGTSMASIIRRARDLRKITESKYKQLNIALGATGQRKQEFYPIPFEEPEAYSNLKRFHTDHLGFEKGDMAKLLFIEDFNPIDTSAILIAPCLRLVGLFDQQAD